MNPSTNPKADEPARRNPVVNQWPEDAELLTRVQSLLASGNPTAAIQAIVASKSKTSWAQNALGVCQLRLENPNVALDIYRNLVLTTGGLMMKPDLPTVFKTNYATALFQVGNIPGGLSVLTEAGDESHPAVRRLREAVQQYRRGLSFWQRLNWTLGSMPEQPLPLDAPPGDLI